LRGSSNGGYVVKYLLTTKGNEDYFGDGNEGTLTWDYELTNVGKSLQIQLPDASNVVNTPGLLIYDTSTIWVGCCKTKWISATQKPLWSINKVMKF